MIATVRIASLEHWCASALMAARIEKADPRRNVGQEVRILTETLRQSNWCEGKAWIQEDTSIDEFRIQAGLPPRQVNLGPRVVCEHMLEMD